MGSSRSSHYLALKQIAKVSNSAFSLRKICNSIAKTTAKAMGANGCRVSLLDPQKEYLLTVGTHGLSDLYLRKGPLDAHKSLPEVLDGKVVVIPDATKDERVQHPKIAETQRVCSILGAPILEREEVIGEIRVYTREPHQFSEADKSFLTSVANISAVLLERAELHQLLEKGYRVNEEQAKLVQMPQLPTTSLRPTEFAHPSEEEFARLLDFYRIEWLYEPRSFPLRWKGGEIAEMFTPDFYLPELDLYVELTTLKQNLITEKNRKLRQLKELYPEIKIKLLSKGDFHKLLAKYGYSPLGEAKIEGVSRILYSHSQIQRRIRTLAKRISHDYAGQRLVMVGILKGVVCFLADLMQHLSLPVTVDFMAISYYGGDDGQVVKITKDLDSSITGQHVLMIEDIVDTGMTLNYVLGHLLAHNPASLRVCTLLDKGARRLTNVPLDYIGFEIPDEFVVGYGLDYKGEYRNLPFIGILRAELIKEDKL
ncbi:MAG: hypoxanthine phosphoribosyltransferase [Chloroflexi bacterium CG23_combo_of_CG06-09_8_20_14_all_45_10]|nr:MAG: hypoxanthine phosphoribosyltransferase [Chloroflexi bacterium CG23_combo_of_CG06-09_8_20_14_all_45_10]